MTVNRVSKYGTIEGGTTALRAAFSTGALLDGQLYFDTDLQQLLVWSATNSRWQTSGGSLAGTAGVAPSTVAAAGNQASNAAALGYGLVLVTGADATKGVILPVASANARLTVKNDEAANAALKIYPQTNSQINNLGANTAYSMTANACSDIVAYNATQWFTVPKVSS